MKKFHIYDNNDSNNEIRHKEIVCYLIMHLNFKVNYNQYIKAQIETAQRHLLQVNTSSIQKTSTT